MTTETTKPARKPRAKKLAPEVKEEVKVEAVTDVFEALDIPKPEAAVDTPAPETVEIAVGTKVKFSEEDNAYWYDVVEIDGDNLTVRKIHPHYTFIPQIKDKSAVLVVANKD